MTKAKKLDRALKLIDSLKRTFNDRQVESCKCSRCELLRELYREIFNCEKEMV